MKNILVTGGAGYIGSHTVVELVAAGFRPVILDNFSNSDRRSIEGLERITGQQLAFYEQDFHDKTKVREIIEKESIDGVINFAAFKAVGESVAEPLKYYQNNVVGFVSLLEILLAAGVHNIVFSSTAAVYGNPPTSEATEATPCNPENPYGWSKLMDEIILRDTCAANSLLQGVVLRYFNVVGSHESALIGESPKGKPQNLLPIIVRAVATNQPLTVFGNDYETTDGTCLRDYVHVVDLAKAHVAALRKIMNDSTENYRIYNIGTGKPTSVLELITTFEQVNNMKVPYEIGPRRPGDPAAYYASATKAEADFGWHAEKSIEDAVRDAWRWQHLTKEGSSS
jgi:UDP-glucose 4-epimerase